MNKLILLTLTAFFTMSSFTIRNDNTSCKYSTSKIRALVKTNWSDIQQQANFTISGKKDFEVRNYRRDGDDIVVDILSKGFLYDITFTVSFSTFFRSDCSLYGDVLDVYNYKKK